MRKKNRPRRSNNANGPPGVRVVPTLSHVLCPVNRKNGRLEIPQGVILLDCGNKLQFSSTDSLSVPSESACADRLPALPVFQEEGKLPTLKKLEGF